MDALKLVPQIFFDAIARVVPGAVAIFLFFLFFDPGCIHWQQFVRGILGGNPDKALPSGFITVTLALAAYLTGHLISPGVKMIERVVDAFPTSIYRREKDWAKATQDKYKKDSSYNYDWLRLNKTEAGGLCAKVRAEFTMYDALAVVFFGFALAVVWQKHHNLYPALVLVSGLVALGLLMSARGRETHKTFLKMIEHFCEATKGDSRPAGDTKA